MCGSDESRLVSRSNNGPDSRDAPKKLFILLTKICLEACVHSQTELELYHTEPGVYKEPQLKLSGVPITNWISASVFLTQYFLLVVDNSRRTLRKNIIHLRTCCMKWYIQYVVYIICTIQILPAISCRAAPDSGRVLTKLSGSTQLPDHQLALPFTLPA